MYTKAVLRSGGRPSCVPEASHRMRTPGERTVPWASQERTNPKPRAPNVVHDSTGRAGTGTQGETDERHSPAQNRRPLDPGMAARGHGILGAHRPPHGQPQPDLLRTLRAHRLLDLEPV